MKVCLSAYLLLLPVANAFISPKSAGATLRRTISVDRFQAIEDKDLMEDVDGLAKAVDNYNNEKMVDVGEYSSSNKEDYMQLMIDLESEADKAASEMMDEECEVDEKGMAADELCVDENKRKSFRQGLRDTISKTMGIVRGLPTEEKDAAEMEKSDDMAAVGDLLEQGWESRGSASALRRNAEVWKFALKCVFRALKPRSMRKKGASEEEIKQAQIDAATFIRDGLLTLGPTFVKLVRRLPSFSNFSEAYFVILTL